MQNNKILLTISVMASNRPETTEKCFLSLAKLRKEIPCELIVTDTGCDSKMRRMVESYADKVIEFTWCNDFSKARQASLDIARGEWYMYVDDDEWFIDTEELIAFFKGEAHKRCGFATYVQRNYHDWDGETYSDAWVGRMIKVTPEVHFEDKIHEHLEPIAGLEIAAINSIVEHYGYLHRTKEEELRHYERNTKLLLEMIQEKPTEMRSYIHLMQEYRSADEYDQMIQTARDALSIVLKHPKYEDRTDITGLYAAIVLANTASGRMKEVVEVAGEMKNAPFVTRTGLAYCNMYLANAYISLKEDAKARECIEEYLSLRDYLEKNPPEKFMESISVFAGKALDDESLARVYSMALLLDLRARNYTHFEEYVKKLGWEKKNLFIYEGLLEEIGYAMARPLKDAEEEKHWKAFLSYIIDNKFIWSKIIEIELTYEAKEELDETNLLRKIALVDRYDWFVMYARMRMVDGLQLVKYYSMIPLELWKDILHEYCEYRGWQETVTLEDYFAKLQIEQLHREYLHLFVLELYLCFGISDLSVEEQQAKYLEYGQAMVAFCNVIDAKAKESSLQDEMDLQQEREAATCLIDAFATDDVRDRLKALRDASVALPHLAPSIQTYMTRAQAEQQKQQLAALDEMESLKKQILEQANVLIEAGEIGQARAILEQLKPMLPNDLEVANMCLRATLAKR